VPAGGYLLLGREQTRDKLITYAYFPGQRFSLPLANLTGSTSGCRRVGFLKRNSAQMGEMPINSFRHHSTGSCGYLVHYVVTPTQKSAEAGRDDSGAFLLPSQ
jgi:hypothetical protein